MKILGIIENVVMNLFSSQLYDGKNSIIFKMKLWLFRKKLMKWIRRFIKSHDGTVLSTGDFERFITNYKLIEHIFSQASATTISKSKDEFVNDEIQLFHSIQNNPEKNSFDTDDLLKKFILHLYDEINMFYSNNLSQNDKYIVSRIEAKGNETHDSIERGIKGIAEIKELLLQKNEINNSDLLWEVYLTLSKSILSGNVSGVSPLYPLLDGKSDDLKYSISYLLGLFSCEKSHISDFNIIQNKIVDERIYNDICRLSIYIDLWRKNLNELKKVSDRNTDLHDITQAILTDKYDNFFLFETTEQDGITYDNYHFENNYPNELWLTRRIIFLYIMQHPVSNTSTIIPQIIENPDNILDRVIIWECRLTEIFNKLEINKGEIKELYNEINALSNIANELFIDLKEKIYVMLVRCALLISNDDAEIAANKIPQDLYGHKDIDLLITEVRLCKEIINVDDVIKTCMKYDEYWPFYNYLSRIANDDPNGAKELIERYRFIIDKNLAICLMYIELINMLIDNKNAVELLSIYQNLYGKYLEFWITKMRISYDDTELSYMIAEYKSGHLNQLSTGGELEFIKLLIQHKQYEDVLKIIECHEKIGSINSDYHRYKAIALCFTKHEVEALPIFIKLFESGNHSEEIIYYILALSSNNCRKVSDTILVCAEKSEKPQILFLTANILAMDNNVEKAHILNIKAMLHTHDDKSEVFGQHLGLAIYKDHSEETQIIGANDDTVAYLESFDGNIKKAFAIHSKHLLPEEPYYWENACHIYKETAINIGLFRKKIGESIIIDDYCYVIKEIIKLDAYFFRVSMDKVVADGKATMLTIPVSENGKMDAEQFVQKIKNIVGDSNTHLTWLEQYKDLSHIPVTFFLSKRCVRGTYFQFVSAILETDTILFRAGSSATISRATDYIFSFSALIALFKLGWKCSDTQTRYAIPQALKTMILTETEEIICENNRKHVSFMGVSENRLYMIENSEEKKTHYMQEAVAFKSFINRFFVINNEKDLHLNSDQHVIIKDVLGIADYDALLIAKNQKRLLVSVEPMIDGISQMPEIDVQRIGIVDFITEEASNIDELFSYVKGMMKFKFIVPFSLRTVKRIITFYNNATEAEQKSIINQWSNILDYPLNDETYQEVMISCIKECVLDLKNDKEMINPISHCLLVSWLKYSGKKLQIYITEEGELFAELVQA